MNKLLIAILFTAVAGVANAQTIDTRGLNKQQIAELQTQRDKMLSPEGVSASVRNEAKAWADLGANIGTAMVSAAKEVGIAANEFGQTQLGKIVTGIVVYKVMGKDILGIVVGSFVMLFCFSIAVWAMATKRFGEVKYEYKPALWGLYNRRVITEYKLNDGSAKVLCIFVPIGVGLLVGLNCIF